MAITKETYKTIYEYHKEGYEKHFIPNSLLNLAGIVCFIIIFFTSPYASPVVIVFFFLLSIASKRDGHREGFIDGVTEASSLYGSARTRAIYGEDKDVEYDMEADELLETPEFINQMKLTLKFLKEKDMTVNTNDERFPEQEQSYQKPQPKTENTKEYNRVAKKLSLKPKITKEQFESLEHKFKE